MHTASSSRQARRPAATSLARTFRANGGLPIHRHVDGTRPDESVPRTCPQMERSSVAVQVPRVSAGVLIAAAAAATVDPLLDEEVPCSVRNGNKKPPFAA